jgi:hypothetical protein
MQLDFDRKSSIYFEKRSSAAVAELILSKIPVVWKKPNNMSVVDSFPRLKIGFESVEVDIEVIVGRVEGKKESVKK